LLLKQAVYTASLTVAYSSFLVFHRIVVSVVFSSNRCLKTLRISAVGDIKAGNSACSDMKEGSYTLF